MGLNDIKYGYEYSPYKSKQAEDGLTPIGKIPQLTHPLLWVMILGAS